jgi:hypothetical protein
LTVHDLPCSNIFFFGDSQHIECIHSSLPGEVSTDEIRLTIQSSVLQGIHLQPLTISRSRSNRPVLANASIQSLPFLPYTVEIPNSLPSSERGGDAPSPSPSWMYWSDLSSGEIFRSHLDGEHIQLVLQKVHSTLPFIPPSDWNSHWLQVDRVYGIKVMEDEVNSQHQVFYTDASKGILGRIKVTSQGPPPPSISLPDSLFVISCFP